MEETIKKTRAPRKKKVPTLVEKAEKRTKVETKPRAYSSRAYGAAASSFRNDGWFTPNSSANTEITAALPIMRNRARDLVRNAPWAKAAVDKLVTYMLGPGVQPSISTGDEKLDRKALSLFKRWSRLCTADGLTFGGLQLLLARSWIESGEVLGRRRARFQQDMMDHFGPLPPIVIQPLESDMLDHAYTIQRGGNKVIAGVEYDPIDRRVAYHLFPTHPGETLGSLFSFPATTTSLDRTRVSADNIFHLYEVTRPGQVRGISWLHSVVQALKDLDDYADAERVRAKSAACVVASVQGGDPSAGEPEGVDGMAPASDENGDMVTDGFGNPVEQFGPGMIIHAPSGKTISWNTPAPPANDGWIRVGLREIAAGLNLDYVTLTGDLSQGNFSFHKLSATERKTRMAQLRDNYFAPMALTPIWFWFVEAAIAAGLLPDNPNLYEVEWSSPALESADREAQVKADILEMRAGLKSRKMIIRDRGYDPEMVNASFDEDSKERAEIGLVIDGDASQVTLSGGAQTDYSNNDNSNNDGAQ